MRKLIRCGRLFTGNETNALSDQTLVIEDDKVVFAGPAAKAPEAAPHDEVIDHSRHFVMPGPSSTRTSISPMATRKPRRTSTSTLRSSFARFADWRPRSAYCAGYTAMADLSISGRVSL